MSPTLETAQPSRWGPAAATPSHPRARLQPGQGEETEARVRGTRDRVEPASLGLPHAPAWACPLMPGCRGLSTV